MTKKSHSHTWKRLYAAAMLESDSTLLAHRIKAADAAIQNRLKELPKTISHCSEKTELCSALRYLGCLKDTLSTPRQHGEPGIRIAPTANQR